MGQEIDVVFHKESLDNIDSHIAHGTPRPLISAVEKKSYGYISLISELLCLRQDTDEIKESNEATRRRLNEIYSDSAQMDMLIDEVNQRITILPERHQLAVKLRYDLDNPGSNLLNSLRTVSQQIPSREIGKVGISPSGAREILNVAEGRLRKSLMYQPILDFSIPDFRRSRIQK